MRYSINKLIKASIIQLNEEIVLRCKIQIELINSYNKILINDKSNSIRKVEIIRRLYADTIETISRFIDRGFINRNNNAMIRVRETTFSSYDARHSMVKLFILSISLTIYLVY
jgi:hypothetical protein